MKHGYAKRRNTYILHILRNLNVFGLMQQERILEGGRVVVQFLDFKKGSKIGIV